MSAGPRWTAGLLLEKAGIEGQRKRSRNFIWIEIQASKFGLAWT